MSLALICPECYRHTPHAGNPFIKKNPSFHKGLQFGSVLLKRYDSQTELMWF